MPVEWGDMDVPAFDLAGLEIREPGVEDVVEHLLYAEEIRGPGIEARRDPEHAHAWSLHESQRGIEVRLHLLERDLCVVPVVRVSGGDAVRPVPLRDAFAHAPGGVCVDVQIPRTAQEGGRRQADVGPVCLAGPARCGIAARYDEPGVRLVQEIPLHAPDKQIRRLREVVHLAHTHAEYPELGAAYPASQLSARADRHLLAFQQSHPAAEERIDVGAGPGDAAGRARARAREAEHACVLKEERPLLGEEEREAVQVDLAQVDLGLSEIRVHRADHPQARRDPVGDVQAGFRAHVRRPRTVEAQRIAADEGTDLHTDSLVQPFERADLSRLGNLEELCLEPGSRPSDILQSPIDLAREVEAPDAPFVREAQALEGNHELCGPAGLGPARPHVPGRIPVRVQLPVGVGEPVHERTRRVRGEVEGVSLVPEGVEEDLDAVVRVEIAVARQLGPEN